MSPYYKLECRANVGTGIESRVYERTFNTLSKLIGFLEEDLKYDKRSGYRHLTYKIYRVGLGFSSELKLPIDMGPNDGAGTAKDIL